MMAREIYASGGLLLDGGIEFVRVVGMNGQRTLSITREVASEKQCHLSTSFSKSGAIVSRKTPWPSISNI